MVEWISRADSDSLGQLASMPLGPRSSSGWPLCISFEMSGTPLHILNPWTPPPPRQEFKRLAQAMVRGEATEEGPPPPDQLSKQWSLVPPVIVDGVPSGGRFCLCYAVHTLKAFHGTDWLYGSVVCAMHIPPHQAARQLPPPSSASCVGGDCGVGDGAKLSNKFSAVAPVCRQEIWGRRRRCGPRGVCGGGDGAGGVPCRLPTE